MIFIYKRICSFFGFPESFPEWSIAYHVDGTFVYEFFR